MRRKNKSSKRQNKKLREIRLNKLLVEAQTHHNQRRLEQARDIYQQVLQARPDNAAALHGLGLIALDIGMPETAIEFFTAALQSDAGNTVVKKALALAYIRQNRIDIATELYRELLEWNDSDGDAHGELARLYLLSGKLDEARVHFKRAFAVNPSDPKNLHGLAQLDSDSITDEVLKTVEIQLAKPELALQDRSSFYFALGRIHDQAGRYEEAFANYSVANLAKPMHYEREKHTRFITQTIDIFNAELFERHTDAGNTTSRPVFIVGMPRSGTTLVEQILASHPDVHAAGELNHIEHLVGSLSSQTDPQPPYPQLLGAVTSADIRSMADAQERLIVQTAGHNASRITDKMPLNFLHLGLIALMFPNAHIVHCRRNPLDTCLSCYFQNLSGNHSYAGDLENLGHYYRQYERLMLHWYRVLPLLIHTVDYEKLVAEPETASKQMLAYLGLDWHEDCLHFHRTRRQVNTASLVQVRKPLYTSSVERWRNYDRHLSPLKTALGTEDSASATRADSISGLQGAGRGAFESFGYGT